MTQFQVVATGFKRTDEDALVGQIPEDWNQYCIGMNRQGQVVTAFRCVDTEPIGVTPLSNGYNVVVPGPSLEMAMQGAEETLAKYMED